MFWRITCIFSGLVLLYVGLAFLLWPSAHIALLAAPEDVSGRIMGARSAALYGALALLLFLFAGHDELRVRRAISLVGIVAFGGLALIGLTHILQGAVGAGVWLAILAETATAAVFAIHLFRR